MYPLTDVITQDVSAFDPSLQVPYADTYTIGVQRGLTRTMAVEVRYVGTRSREQIFDLQRERDEHHENDFLSEFKLAQANLISHVSAGCGIDRSAGVLLRVPRARHRHVAAADLPRVPERLARHRAPPRRTPAATGPTPRSSTRWRGSIRSRSRPSARSTTMLRGVPTPLRRGYRETSSWPTRTTWVARTSAATATTPASTGSRWSCAAGSRTASPVPVELRLRHPTSDAEFYSFRVGRKTVRQFGGEGRSHARLQAHWMFELPFGQGKRWRATPTA